MEYIELIAFGVLFTGIGLVVGLYLVPDKYKLVYGVLCLFYGISVILFSGMNLNFPIRTSELMGGGGNAPYWLIIINLSGKFLPIGALSSWAGSIKKNET